MALLLVVVDEPDTMLSLRRDLEAAGHRSVLAADADTARERLDGWPIDVVLLDVMMPVRDGWSVLEALAAPPHAPPAIVISPRAGPGDRQRATRLGAAVVLAATFTFPDVLDAIATVTAHSAATPRSPSV